jgi:PBSX family phage terminase large subunit
MLSLSHSQDVFLNGLNTKFRAYVGGYGSGKTFVGCLDLLIFFSKHPGTRQGYFGPTYPSIRDIFFPTFEEAAELMGFDVDIKESNKEVHVYRNGKYYGTVICRSMEKPSSIVGFKISRALVDEIDTLTKIKAEQAWNKIISRLRLKIEGVENGIGVTTTPEGFMFVYERFKRNPTESYSMVQASTYENEEYLPDDYISSLKESYPASLIDAYIDGDFVNLNSGTVYHEFDRDLNKSDELMQDGEHLYIGMDFNVGKMSAVIHVKRGDDAHAVDEIMGAYDTSNMIQLIKDKYWTYSNGKYNKTRNLYIYPDASGDSRKTVDASTTDIGLLEQAGFFVIVDGSNPRVKDRINSVNAMFKNAKGERRYFVNPNMCRLTVEAFEQQAYNANGEPDKTKDTDHPIDAAGYFIVHDYPIVKPTMAPRIRHF